MSDKNNFSKVVGKNQGYIAAFDGYDLHYKIKNNTKNSMRYKIADFVGAYISLSGAKYSTVFKPAKIRLSDKSCLIMDEMILINPGSECLITYEEFTIPGINNISDLTEGYISNPLGKFKLEKTSTYEFNTALWPDFYKDLYEKKLSEIH